MLILELLTCKVSKDLNKPLTYWIGLKCWELYVTSGNPCLQGTDGFQVWHISSGHKVTSNLEHPLSRS